MAADAPPSQIPVRNDHPQKPNNIFNKDRPIETNKFYANLFLGTQTNPVWTHPYSLAWAKGRGNTWGLAVTHVERNQFAWGPGDVPQYFIGPVGIQHIVFSALELDSSTTLTTESLTAFSVYANLAPSPDSQPLISFPLVQGMGMITAVYNKATPLLNSGTFFRSLKYAGQINGVTYKYQITLEDSSSWVLYATPAGSLGAPPFKLNNSSTIIGPEDFRGIIQVAKNPLGPTGETTYDASAGSFAINATISGSVQESVTGHIGTYSLSWAKGGIQNQTLVMFALPHHVESFDEGTSATLTGIELVTVTKGIAKAVKADKITMIENNLPSKIGFGPWVSASEGGGSGDTQQPILPPVVKANINSAGTLELGQDMIKQTSLNSMYYSGKVSTFLLLLQEVQFLTYIVRASPNSPASSTQSKTSQTTAPSPPPASTNSKTPSTSS